MTTSLEQVRLRLERPDGVRRLGQALWMVVGQPVLPPQLLWARGLIGDDGEAILWTALQDYGCFQGPERVLDARTLASFLGTLWDDPSEHVGDLLWTLPAGFAAVGVIDPGGYVAGALKVIRSARSRLMLVSPYLEAEGIGQLQQELLIALRNGVGITVVTHSVEDPSSRASRALEAVRREASGLPGTLRVFVAGRDTDILFHSKLIAADGVNGIVGSANLTGPGFGRNLETGVTISSQAAVEIELVVGAAIRQGLLTLVFQTGP